MALTGEYKPSTWGWVNEHVETIEATGGTPSLEILGGAPVVLLTTRGAKTGAVRKSPLMRVEHGGQYAAIASKGGAPKHPSWYFNLKADPEAVLQDGAEAFDVVAAEIEGEERELWFQRGVEAYPPYAEYQKKTDRLIPVFLLTRRAR